MDEDDDGDDVLTVIETAGSAGRRDQDFDGRPDHVDSRLELPDGVEAPTPAAPEVPPAAQEPPPSAAEQVGAALDAGLAAVQEAALPKDDGTCGCATSTAPRALLGALGALALARRARRRAA